MVVQTPNDVTTGFYEIGSDAVEPSPITNNLSSWQAKGSDSRSSRSTTIGHWAPTPKSCFSIDDCFDEESGIGGNWCW